MRSPAIRWPRWDSQQHMALCSALTLIAFRIRLIPDLSEPWLRAYDLGRFGRPWVLARVPPSRCAQERVRELVRFLHAIYDAHNYLRYASRRLQNVDEGYRMILRLVKAMHFGVVKQSLRARARRSARHRPGVPQSSSSSDSLSDDSPEDLASLRMADLPALAGPDPPTEGLPGDLSFDESLAIR